MGKRFVTMGYHSMAHLLLHSFLGESVASTIKDIFYSSLLQTKYLK